MCILLYNFVINTFIDFVNILHFHCDVHCQIHVIGILAIDVLY